MLELIIQGTKPAQTQRHPLPSGTRLVIGREASNVAIPWDPLISRNHVQLDVRPGHVQLSRLPNARNPLFFGGEAVDSCRVEIGQHFVIGSTSFQLAAAEPNGTSLAQPVEEFAFKPQELRKIRYQDPDNRIEVLTHLP